MSLLDQFVIWLGAAATLGIFSFLWKENPVYRFFEHLYMGLTVGWVIVLTWKNVLEPKWFSPLTGVGLPEGEAWAWTNLFWLLALFAGAMWYFIFTKKHKWIARIIIGFFIGTGAGLGIQGFFRMYLPQITASFKSLWVKSTDESGKVSLSWKAILNNLVFLVTFYCSMIYFIFTFRRDRPVMKGAATAGRWLMMIAFGAMFGSTVMARLSLLIERVQFLVVDWVQGVIF